MHAVTTAPRAAVLDAEWRCPDYPPTDWLPPTFGGYDPHDDNGFELGLATDDGDIFDAIAGCLVLVLIVVLLPALIALAGAVV